MRNNHRLFLIVWMLAMPVDVVCQSASIENAKQKIYSSKTEVERLANLVAIGKLRNSLHGDTILFYAQWAKKLALQLNDSRSLAWAEYSLISSDLAKGKTDSVIQKIDNNKAFVNIHTSDAALYYKIQLLKANALNRVNNRTAALELQLKLLGESEKEGNTNAQLFALNFIGATYLNVAKPAEAKQAWLQGLQIIKDKNKAENNEIAAYILSNLALYYFNDYYIKRTKETGDSFFTAINKTIELSRQNENLGVLASALSIRGNFYGVTHQFDAGEKDIKEGLEVRKKVGDPLYIINDLAALADFYLNQKKYKNAVETAKEGIAVANSNGIKGSEVISLITITGSAYKASGDYQQYSNTLEQYIAVADSGNRLNAADKITEIQTKYEVQKKETLIAQQKLALFQRKLLLYGGSILAALLLVFFAYRFKKYQQQQQIRLAAMLQEKKLQHDAAVKDAEENERRRIAAELHDNLGVQANAILHNSSLLQDEHTVANTVVADIKETAKEMLHNLRETLWAMKTTDVAAADLWLRIINFMKQMGRHYTTITFKVEGEAPPDFILSSTKALNIVLVIQEAVNNAVKHSGAAVITAGSTTKSNEWTISIRDEGKGFDLNAVQSKADHYGLENIKQRAMAADFKYLIESNPGDVTVVSLMVKP
ncbi:MAG: hypothetical protein IPP72_03935 [Chitinophagaceae bacterium]|nr:hypothetical protein [Chitinophagaceae bacterium]